MEFYNRCYKLIRKKPVKCKSIQDYIDAYKSNRKIKQTVIGEKTVETVFLVFDHNYGESDQPILFETTVFPECNICERYNDYDTAVEGHNIIVNKFIIRKYLFHLKRILLTIYALNDKDTFVL